MYISIYDPRQSSTVLIIFQAKIDQTFEGCKRVAGIADNIKKLVKNMTATCMVYSQANWELAALRGCNIPIDGDECK